MTQCSPAKLCQWLQKKQKPQLQALLRICFYLAVPLVDFLTIPRERSASQSQALEKQACLKQEKIPRKNFKSEQLQNLLEGVLKDKKGEPLSMKEVARRLGRHELYLYHKFPALARAISAKHRDYQRAIRQNKVPYEKIGLRASRKQGQGTDWEKLWKTLEAILADKQRTPPSMKRVATQLGYFQTELSRRYPDLCQSISARYLENRRRESENRIQMLGQQVRQAMFSLHEQGCHPSIQRSRDQPNNAWLFRDPYTKAVWRETLSELSARQGDINT